MAISGLVRKKRPSAGIETRVGSIAGDGTSAGVGSSR